MTGRRPAPVGNAYTTNGAADRDFMRNAVCRHYDPEIWFPSAGTGTSLNQNSLHRLEAHAKAICATCPVVYECRDYAKAMDTRFGIWGALTARELQNGSAA